MLSVFQVEFDHDWSNKAELFNQFADKLIASAAFETEPTREHSPIFSYSQLGLEHLDDLASRIGNNEAIIFLSDICSYSFVLVQSAGDKDFTQTKFSTYDTFLSLQTKPMLRGYSACGSIRPTENDFLFISLLPYGLFDAKTNKPSTAIVQTVAELATDLGTIYCYRILERQGFFENFVSVDWPVYCFRDSTCNIETALERYRKEELTEYLLSIRAAFGTVNENHQDDYYAISYREKLWQQDDTKLAFIA